MSQSLAEASSTTSEQGNLVAALAADEGEVRVLVDAQLAPSVDGAESVTGTSASSASVGGGSIGGGDRPTAPRFNSQRLLEECGALETKNNTHVSESLPTLARLDAHLRGVQDVSEEAKHDATTRLYHRLRAISALQSQICELRNKLHLYASLLNRVHMYCAQLHLIRTLPATYHACLEEIRRRHKAAEHATELMAKAAENLATTRDAEVQRRDAFMRTHGALLPRGLPALSQLLQERPLFVEVSASANADTRLMELSTALETSISSRSRPDASAALAPSATHHPTLEATPEETSSPPPDTPPDAADGVDALAPTHAANVASAPSDAPPPAAPAAAASTTTAAAAPAAAPAAASTSAADATLPSVPPPVDISADEGVSPPDESPQLPPPPSSTPLPGSPQQVARPMIARSQSEASALHRAGNRRDVASELGGMWNSAAIAALDEAAGGAPPTMSAEELQAAHGFASADGSSGLGGSGSALALAPPAARRVLTDPGRLPGKLSDLSAALEALGTPLDGVPVEVASQLRTKVAQQQQTTQQLRKLCASHAAARTAAEREVERQKAEMAGLREQLARANTAAAAARTHPPADVSDATEGGNASDSGEAEQRATVDASDGRSGGGTHAPPAAVQLNVHIDSGAPARAEALAAAHDAGGSSEADSAETPSLGLAITPLHVEIASLEASNSEMGSAQHKLLSAVKTAMSCLPPPGPLRQRSPNPGSPNPVRGSAVGGTMDGADGDEHSANEADDERGPPGSVERISSDLCSSARQAAHANARLGHAMATERESHKAAVALAGKRLSYLSADVNARLLFVAQPHSAGRTERGGGLAGVPGGVAFAALMLPTLRGGMASHWLSNESVESLRRWCEEEAMPLQSLRCVVGRVVHVSGPIEVPAPDGAASASSAADAHEAALPVVSSTSSLCVGSGLGASSTAGKAAPVERPKENVYGLPPGEHYYVVHAEMVLQHRWSAM